jgi:hypothetical protein
MARAARSRTATVRVHRTSVGAGCGAAAAVRPRLGPFLAPFLGCSATWTRWDCRTRSPESCGCPVPSTCRSLRLSGGVWGCLGAGLCSSHGGPQTPAAPPPELTPMYGRWSRWWMPARMVAASTALAAGWLQVVLERGAACIEVFVDFKSTVSLSTALSPVGSRVRSQ